MIFRTIVELVKNRKKWLTREEAELTYYNGKKTAEEIYEDFKKEINKRIKFDSKYDTSIVIEIRKQAILERLNDLVKFYKEDLNYNVVVIDEKILGDNWDRVYMLISWKRADP